MAFYLIRGTLYPIEQRGYSLTVFENGCNHEGILTFTVILEFCSPVHKIIYFIEFISELYIESIVLDKRKQNISRGLFLMLIN